VKKGFFGRSLRIELGSQSWSVCFSARDGADSLARMARGSLPTCWPTTRTPRLFTEADIERLLAD
jgi:hypothetical protein